MQYLRCMKGIAKDDRQVRGKRLSSRWLRVCWFHSCGSQVPARSTSWRSRPRPPARGTRPWPPSSAAPWPPSCWPCSSSASSIVRGSSWRRNPAVSFELSLCLRILSKRVYRHCHVCVPRESWVRQGSRKGTEGAGKWIWQPSSPKEAPREQTDEWTEKAATSPATRQQ